MTRLAKIVILLDRKSNHIPCLGSRHTNNLALDLNSCSCLRGFKYEQSIHLNHSVKIPGKTFHVIISIKVFSGNFCHNVFFLPASNFESSRQALILNTWSIVYEIIRSQVFSKTCREIVRFVSKSLAGREERPTPPPSPVISRLATAAAFYRHLASTRKPLLEYVFIYLINILTGVATPKRVINW